MEQALSLAADRFVLVVVDVQNDDCHEDGHNVRTYFGRVLTSVEIERAWAEGPAG